MYWNGIQKTLLQGERKSDRYLGYEKTQKYFSNSKCILGYGIESKVRNEEVHKILGMKRESTRAVE